MKTYRKTAAIIGILFILATVSSIIGTFGFLEPILSDADYLTQISENKIQFILGVLIDSINSIVVVAIGVLLFPFLKRYKETYAIGYISARIIESVVLIIGHISVLSLLTLSQTYLTAAAIDASYFQTLGSLLLSVGEWTVSLGPTIVLSITALILNYVFYRTKMIPRFISVWGLIGVPCMFVSGLIGIFTMNPFSTIGSLLIIPLAVNEMVLGVWLITKGINLSQVNQESIQNEGITL